jgi:hypothetical protein
MTDEEFANGFAHLIEVVQKGRARPATPNDVLELIGSGGPRYVLKRPNGEYMGRGGSGFTPEQRRALVIDDLETAREAKRVGMSEYGVRVNVVRIRRRGTCGLELVRLRPDLDITREADSIAIAMTPADAMKLLATISRAKTGDGVQ